MTNNVLPQTPPPPPIKNKKKHKVSWVAVLFLIFLTIALIILGEVFMKDLNNWFNPAYPQYSSDTYRSSYIYSETIASSSYDRADYEMYRLLIHTALVIPVLLAGFLLYFWLHFKKPESYKKIISYPFFFFSIWMTLHLIFEAFYFLIKQYEKVGIYVVLVILVGLFTWLVLFVQKKWHQKHNL